MSRILYQNELTRLYKLILPLHVVFIKGSFIFRYAYPPILRLLIRRREYKINLGKNLEAAQVHAHKLNCIVNTIQKEMKILHDEAQNKVPQNSPIGSDKVKILLHYLHENPERAENLYNTCNFLKNYMAVQASSNFLDALLNQIRVANTEIAPEDKVKLNVRARLQNAVNQIEHVDAPSVKLSQVFNEWRDEKRKKIIKQSTEKVLATVWKELYWFFGDVDVSKITEEQMKEYYAFWVGQVPPLRLRAPLYGEVLSYDEVKKKIARKEITDFVSDTHKQNMLVYIREFLDWCVSPVRKVKYFPTEYSSYLKEIETHRKRRGNKRGFTEQEIKELRAQLMEFKNKADSMYGDIRWRYWIFHILLLTGARPAEIGQLRVNDVLKQGSYNPLASRGTKSILEVPCFLISELEVDADGGKCELSNKRIAPKSVKNDGSERLVPIHSWLIEDGFMDYVESRRKSGKTMLFDIKYRKDNGYSAIIVKYYGRVIQSLYPDYKERNIKLYSTRNNFEEKILRIGKDNYDTYVCQRLTGRIPQEGSVEAYRDQAEVSRLNAIVQAVEYEFMTNSEQRS